MTDVLLASVAIASIFVAGCGAALLLLPRQRPIAPAELLGFGYLAGAAFVSLLSFACGLLVSGRALQLLVLTSCLALGATGAVIGRRGAPTRRWAVAPPDLLRAAAPLLPALAVGWLTLQVPMAWDGTVVWEAKARLAWMNGGGLPLSYFGQPYRSHPDYPLLVPMLEAWVYGWLGHVDQVLVKVVFPGFVAAALWLLATAAARVGLSVGWSVLAVVLPLCVPRLLLGDGGATTGYSDFPLAVYYLACVVYLLESLRQQRLEALRAAGVLAAVLPWIKQEGTILWACLMILAAIIAARRRRLSALWWTVVPGLLLLIGWRTLLVVADAQMGAAFLPIRPDTFWNNLHRLGLVPPALWRHVTNVAEWSVLWPVAALSGAVAAWGVRAARPVVALLATAVALPTSIYAVIYVFTGLDPQTHIESSLPRLLVQVSLPAILLVVVPAMGWPSTPRLVPDAVGSVDGQDVAGGPRA